MSSSRAKGLKKYYGPAFENGYWRIIQNQKTYNKNKSPGMLIIIKVRRPEWLGIVVRTEFK